MKDRIVSKVAKNSLIKTTKLKWSIRKKMILMIVAATIFSLIMGAPIAYLKYIVMNLGVLSFLGVGIQSIIETYFTLIINLLIMVSFVAFGIKRYILNPIQKIIQGIEGMQEGNKINLLTEINISSKDEFNQLAYAFNGMIKNLKTVIGMVGDTADQVAASTEDMVFSTEQVKESSKEVAHNTQQLAVKAEEGNKSVMDVSQSLLELSSLIQIAQKKAKITNSSSYEMLSTAKDGRKSVITVVEKMDNIKQKSKETKEYILALDHYSKEITDIADMLSDIAAQTNLLALNASIEASRAGEAGKGFAVVASEVRKLAEQSTTRAGKVKELIDKITETSSKTVLINEESQQEVEEGVVAVKLADESLVKIVTSVNEVVEEVNEIVNVTNEKVATSEKIIELIDTVASFIEETAANTEEVSASTEETTASVDTITEGTKNIKEMSAALRDTVKTFKTK